MRNINNECINFKLDKISNDMEIKNQILMESYNHYNNIQILMNAY